MLLYVVVVAEQEITDRGERLPVFSWSLFSEVPDAEKTDYGVRFLAVDGTPLDEPTYFELASDHLSTTRDPAAHSLIDQIGDSLVRDEPMRAALQRDLFESRFLQDLDGARYEVVRRTYDVLDRIECVGCYIDVEVLATFELGG
jgi:hypothetical protein